MVVAVVGKTGRLDLKQPKGADRGRSMPVPFRSRKQNFTPGGKHGKTHGENRLTCCHCRNNRRFWHDVQRLLRFSGGSSRTRSESVAGVVSARHFLPWLCILVGVVNFTCVLACVADCAMIPMAAFVQFICSACMVAVSGMIEEE